MIESVANIAQWLPLLNLPAIAVLVSINSRLATLEAHRTADAQALAKLSDLPGKVLVLETLRHARTN